MTPARREYMIRRAARAMLWADAQQYERDNARRRAVAVIDALIEAPNEGKAIERGLKALERTEDAA